MDNEGIDQFDFFGIFIPYMKNLFCYAWGETRRSLRALVSGAVGRVVKTLWVSFAIFVLLVARLPYGWLSSLFDRNILALAILADLALSTFITILFNLFVYYPAKMYMDSKWKSDRYKWTDIGISRDKIPLGAVLKVVNGKPFTINQAACHLIHIDKAGKKIEGVTPRPLPWVKPSGNTWNRKNIGAKGKQDSTRTVGIANANDDGAWLETRISPEDTSSGQIPLSKNERYKITVSFSGSSDKPMDACEMEYWLTYDGTEFDIQDVK